MNHQAHTALLLGRQKPLICHDVFNVLMSLIRIYIIKKTDKSKHFLDFAMRKHQLNKNENQDVPPQGGNTAIQALEKILDIFLLCDTICITW